MCWLSIRRFAEGAPFFEVRSCPLEGRGHLTDCDVTGNHALGLELCHLLLEALANLADRVLDGHASVDE